MPYMCIMMLLDSRVRSSHSAMPAAPFSTSLRRKGFGGAAPKKFLNTTPFALVINTTYALFSVIKVLE